MKFRFPFKSHSKTSSNDTDGAPEPAWTLIGSAEDHLRSELEKLYWDGVKEELATIFFTLSRWQQPDLESVSLIDENDDFIHGYDTFLDQVNKDSREFALRNGIEKASWLYYTKEDFVSAVGDCLMDSYAQRKSVQLRKAVRSSLEARTKLSLLQRRAKLLLQAAGFLDIDKMIEQRPMGQNFSLWKRPATPQLMFSGFDKHGHPMFVPRHCSKCNTIIRSSMFVGPSRHSVAIYCEECYRDWHYGNTPYTKVYKHCPLQSSITSKVSRDICRCSGVPQSDANGRSRALFPVSLDDEHTSLGWSGRLQCGLFKLGDAVAEAKFRGIQNLPERGIKLLEKDALTKAFQANRPVKKGIKQSTALPNSPQVLGKKAFPKSRYTARLKSNSLPSSDDVLPEDETDEGIPLFIRKHVESNPFGNVRMALRIGTILIENSFSNAKGEVRISMKPSTKLEASKENFYTKSRALALRGDMDRVLYSQERLEKRDKRFKVAMKQVVGAPFSGLLDQQLEADIIDDLLESSHAQCRSPDLRPAEQEKITDEILDRLRAKLKRLMGSQVTIYLQNIAEKLLDSNTDLRWDAQLNNCQIFCDSILSQELFGPLVAPSRVSTSSENNNDSLYAMSFVCRPTGYFKNIVNTKFDVPYGLTEEYLLGYRYGAPSESDIFETLQEYWYDWGAFGGNLYQYQDLFPWDCTEAFGIYPVTCGNCNIAKHVWAFPFDAWSLITLHLTRDRHMYASADLDEPTSISDEDWMRNRLQVLLAQDALITAAAAMAKSQEFRRATDWLHSQENPRLDRFKLGGTHRAQPFSHYFEHGDCHRFFVAEWAHLKREHQIAHYEELRDARMKMLDVPKRGNGGFIRMNGRSTAEGKATTAGKITYHYGFKARPMGQTYIGSPVCASNTTANACGSGCGTGVGDDATTAGGSYTCGGIGGGACGGGGCGAGG